MLQGLTHIPSIYNIIRWYIGDTVKPVFKDLPGLKWSPKTGCLLMQHGNFFVWSTTIIGKLCLHLPLLSCCNDDDYGGGGGDDDDVDDDRNSF